MDEFPSLVQADPHPVLGAPGALGRGTKSHQALPGALRLVGELYEGEFLSQKRPSFGRRTGQYMLLPFFRTGGRALLS